MPLIKPLSQLGNSKAVILDRVLLRQVDIDPDGAVEIAVRDGAIVITPHRHATDEEVDTSAKRVLAQRRRLLERLASR